MADLNPTKMVLAIVPKKSGKEVASIIRDAGGFGATLISGHASSSVSFFALLAGAGEAEMELVISIVDKDRLLPIYQAVKEAALKNPRKYAGAIGVMEVKNMYSQSRKYSADKEASEMDMPTEKWNIISAIVNNGYADEVMQAARKAGARGGTIINGRGTARPDDVKFFGITLVPEKELLYIVCPESHTQEIVDAICSSKCLNTKGAGVLYVQELTAFEYLGKKA